MISRRVPNGGTKGSANVGNRLTDGMMRNRGGAEIWTRSGRVPRWNGEVGRWGFRLGTRKFVNRHKIAVMEQARKNEYVQYVRHRVPHMVHICARAEGDPDARETVQAGDSYSNNSAERIVLNQPSVLRDHAKPKKANARARAMK